MREAGLRYLLLLAVAIVIVAVDQWSKYIAITTLSGRPLVDVVPVLQWGLVFNRGAAFGLLSEAGGIQHYLLSGLALVVSGILLVWLWREVMHNLLLSWGLVLILAGAIGNLIDRIRFRYVVDFINLHYHDWYFPAFNVADMAITGGAILFLLDASGWFRRN